MPSGSATNGQNLAPAEHGGERVQTYNAPKEGVQLTVKQPERIQSLLLVLADLEKIAERISEDRSAGPGGGAVGAGRKGDDGGGATQASLRKQALQSLPALPVMQRRLIAHLDREVRHSEREARGMARTVRKGSAYLLTKLYARIRKIQSLIAELADAAAEVIQRLYIRLFIDHQQLI